MRAERAHRAVRGAKVAVVEPDEMVQLRGCGFPLAVVDPVPEALVLRLRGKRRVRSRERRRVRHVRLAHVRIDEVRGLRGLEPAVQRTGEHLRRRGGADGPRLAVEAQELREPAIEAEGGPGARVGHEARGTPALRREELGQRQEA